MADKLTLAQALRYTETRIDPTVHENNQVIDQITGEMAIYPMEAAALDFSVVNVQVGPNTNQVNAVFNADGSTVTAPATDVYVAALGAADNVPTERAYMGSAVAQYKITRLQQRQLSSRIPIAKAEEFFKTRACLRLAGANLWSSADQTEQGGAFEGLERWFLKYNTTPYPVTRQVNVVGGLSLANIVNLSSRVWSADDSSSNKVLVTNAEGIATIVNQFAPANLVTIQRWRKYPRVPHILGLPLLLNDYQLAAGGPGTWTVGLYCLDIGKGGCNILVPADTNKIIRAVTEDIGTDETTYTLHMDMGCAVFTAAAIAKLVLPVSDAIHDAFNTPARFYTNVTEP